MFNLFFYLLFTLVLLYMAGTPPIEIYNTFLSWPASGRSLGPFLFFRDPKKEVSQALYRHERIHDQQQKELLYFGMWVLYGGWFLYGLVKYMAKGPLAFEIFKDPDKGAYWHAYRNIPFEVEAYKNAGLPLYLVERRAFAWLKYVVK